MNNQQVSSDQLIQLQNFAYLKQFMSRISVKVLMIASFLQVVMMAVSYFIISGTVTDFIYNVIEFAGGSSTANMEEVQSVLSVFDFMMGISGIMAIVTGLILPVTLLIITLRANNDDPTAIPKGAVQFLHVLSIIQFIFSIITAVLGLISSIFIMVSPQENADGTNPVLSAIFSVICYIVYCLYYYYQKRFLGSIKLSCNGYSLMSAGAQGFGVFSVIYAIMNGLFFTFMAIVLIVFSSFSSTTQLGDGNSEWQMFVDLGFMDFMIPVFAIATIMLLINMVIQIATAMIAFGYKNTVTEAVRASYAVTNGPYNRANGAGTPFKTYGGGNAYSSYNYSTSNSSGQQGYQHSAGNSSAPAVTIEKKPQEPDFSQQTEPYNNYGENSFQQDNNYGGGSFQQDNNYGGGSFQQDNNYGGGSFQQDNNYGGGSFQQDNNYYGGGSFQQDNNYGGNSFQQDNNYGGNSFQQNNYYGEDSFQNNEYFTSDNNNDDQTYNSNDNTPPNSSFLNNL